MAALADIIATIAEQTKAIAITLHVASAEDEPTELSRTEATSKYFIKTLYV